MVENFIVLNLLHVSMKLALIMYFWYVVVKIFLQFYDLWLTWGHWIKPSKFLIFHVTYSY